MLQTITIGIDLGTCNSCMARIFENKVKIIQTPMGNITPSIVSFDPINSNGNVIVGELDRRHISNCIYDAKRFIGKFFNDVQKIREKYPFKVEDIDGKLLFKIKQKRRDVFKSPEEIGAEILKYFKECVVTDFDIGTEQEDINVEAVITVPAYFHVFQKNATIKAAELAGIKVLKLMPEPSAAAAVYCSIAPETELGLCLVFDLGGGTFDISCVDIRRNKINVKFVDGDNLLGGVNFDEEIVEYFKNKFLTERQVELDDMQLFRLRGVAKFLKENLSTEDYSKKTVDDFLEDSPQEQFELTRDKFEELNKHWFNKCIDIVKFSFERNNVNKDDIKRVILVGGSTKIRRIRQSLAELFGEEKIYDKLNPDECVAAGAALNARNLQFRTTFEDIDKGKVILKQKVNFFESIKSYDCRKKIIIPPKIAVHNVCPIDISIGSVFNYCKVIIEKNSQLPIEKIYISETIHNDQTELKIPIYEGNYKYSKANTYLGAISLQNLPKAGAGKIKIIVDLDIDDNGFLNIAYLDHGTNKIVTQQIKLDLSDRTNDVNKLSEWNIEKDEAFEDLALLKETYFYYLSRFVYKGVIKTMPGTFKQLYNMSMIDTRTSIKKFLQNVAKTYSKEVIPLKLVDKIYSRNLTLEEKRHKLGRVKYSLQPRAGRQHSLILSIKK